MHWNDGKKGYTQITSPPLADRNDGEPPPASRKAGPAGDKEEGKFQLNSNAACGMEVEILCPAS